MGITKGGKKHSKGTRRASTSAPYRLPYRTVPHLHTVGTVGGGGYGPYRATLLQIAVCCHWQLPLAAQSLCCFHALSVASPRV
eukprot:354239-Chlamydomonas_euryale.AAC.3